MIFMASAEGRIVVVLSIEEVERLRGGAAFSDPGGHLLIAASPDMAFTMAEFGKARDENKLSGPTILSIIATGFAKETERATSATGQDGQVPSAGG